MKHGFISNMKHSNECFKIMLSVIKQFGHRFIELFDLINYFDWNDLTSLI